jgi:hypothetical protein
MAFDLHRLWAGGDRPPVSFLGRLPHGWHVLDPSDGGAEHLVVGLPGVFSVGARDLTGKVWVGQRSVLHNRRRTDFLGASQAQAGRMSALLSTAVGRTIEVRGALAILADEWTIKEQPVGIFVGSPRSVRDWLLRLPPRMTPREVAEITLVAGDPTTWLASSQA